MFEQFNGWFNRCLLTLKFQSCHIKSFQKLQESKWDEVYFLSSISTPICRYPRYRKFKGNWLYAWPKVSWSNEEVCIKLTRLSTFELLGCPVTPILHLTLKYISLSLAQVRSYCPSLWKIMLMVSIYLEKPTTNSLDLKTKSTTKFKEIGIWFMFVQNIQ